MKVYHSSNLSETKQRERELEIMKRLSHENIVKFIAIETEVTSLFSSFSPQMRVSEFRQAC